MDWNIILQLLTGGAAGSVGTALIAWKTRKSEIKKVEASALELMQNTYKNFVTDAQSEFDRLRGEITDLRNQLNNYYTQCSQCSNNKIKR